MPDQTNQTPEESQGLAAYLSPPEAPQYASPPDYKPDVQPFSTAGVFPAQTYAPPPNYQPPPQAAPIVPFEQYHPGPLAQYAAPPDYSPTLSDAQLSSRTVEQAAPGPGLGREPTTYGSGAEAYAPTSWTPQQAHEARQLLPPPHMLEKKPSNPDAGVDDGTYDDPFDEAGAPAGAPPAGTGLAPMAEEKPKDEEKKS